MEDKGSYKPRNRIRIKNTCSGRGSKHHPNDRMKIKWSNQIQCFTYVSKTLLLLLFSSEKVGEFSVCCHFVPGGGLLCRGECPRKWSWAIQAIHPWVEVIVMHLIFSCISSESWRAMQLGFSLIGVVTDGLVGRKASLGDLFEAIGAEEDTGGNKIVLAMFGKRIGNNHINKYS